MSDALNPSDFMDAMRIFIPSVSNEIVDRIFVKSINGDFYSLTSVIGSDAEVGEDFFVICRSPYSEDNLPAGGVWRDVDPRHTKLRTEYRHRHGEPYKDFQELHDVQFWSGDEVIVVSRNMDDFGVEKLMVTVRDGKTASPA